jgi:hypothetical protein
MCGFIAAVVRSGIPLFVGICVALGFYLWRWHVAVLRQMTPEEVASARKADNIFTAVLMFLGFIQ